MNVIDYANAINCDIRMVYFYNQNRWSAKFEHSEVENNEGDIVLVYECGNGSTPEEALKDYVYNIRGKILVFNSDIRDKRREFKVPMNLEA